MVSDSRNGSSGKPRHSLAATLQSFLGSTRALACSDRRPHRSAERAPQSLAAQDPDASAPRLRTRHVSARRSRGFVTMELVAAIGILGAAMLPLAYSFLHEQKVCRAYYFRAVAMELIDGEMEVLAAGEWQSLPEGERVYAIRGESAKNLPAGKFTLTVAASRLRLQWRADKPGQGGTVSREVNLDSVRRTK